jgi:hypothetical protein
MRTLTRDVTGPPGVNLVVFCERAVSRTGILIGLNAMAHPAAGRLRMFS